MSSDAPLFRLTLVEFREWWQHHLSHLHFHVPSEHNHEGKRYNEEIQMYLVSGQEVGVNKQLASVTAFCGL